MFMLNHTKKSNDIYDKIFLKLYFYKLSARNKFATNDMNRRHLKCTVSSLTYLTHQSAL